MEQREREELGALLHAVTPLNTDLSKFPVLTAYLTRLLARAGAPQGATDLDAWVVALIFEAAQQEGGLGKPRRRDGAPTHPLRAAEHLLGLGDYPADINHVVPGTSLSLLDVNRRQRRKPLTKRTDPRSGPLMIRSALGVSAAGYGDDRSGLNRGKPRFNECVDALAKEIESLVNEPDLLVRLERRIGLHELSAPVSDLGVANDPLPTAAEKIGRVELPEDDKIDDLSDLFDSLSEGTSDRQVLSNVVLPDDAVEFSDSNTAQEGPDTTKSERDYTSYQRHHIDSDGWLRRDAVVERLAVQVAELFAQGRYAFLVGSDGMGKERLAVFIGEHLRYQAIKVVDFSTADSLVSGLRRLLKAEGVDTRTASGVDALTALVASHPTWSHVDLIVLSNLTKPINHETLFPVRPNVPIIATIGRGISFYDRSSGDELDSILRVPPLDWSETMSLLRQSLPDMNDALVNELSVNLPGHLLTVLHCRSLLKSLDAEKAEAFARDLVARQGRALQTVGQYGRVSETLGSIYRARILGLAGYPVAQRLFLIAVWARGGLPGVPTAVAWRFYETTTGTSLSDTQLQMSITHLIDSGLILNDRDLLTCDPIATPILFDLTVENGLSMFRAWESYAFGRYLDIREIGRPERTRHRRESQHLAPIAHHALPGRDVAKRQFEGRFTRRVTLIALPPWRWLVVILYGRHRGVGRRKKANPYTVMVRLAQDGIYVRHPGLDDWQANPDPSTFNLVRLAIAESIKSWNHPFMDLEYLLDRMESLDLATAWQTRSTVSIEHAPLPDPREGVPIPSVVANNPRRLFLTRTGGRRVARAQFAQRLNRLRNSRRFVSGVLLATGGVLLLILMVPIAVAWAYGLIVGR